MAQRQEQRMCHRESWKWMQVASESPAPAGGRDNRGLPHVPGRKGMLEKEEHVTSEG